jgi:hypothetical protein
MKKLSATQFARLTELLQKGNALTPDEQAEKASLEQIIVGEDTGDQGTGDSAPAADPEPSDTPDEPEDTTESTGDSDDTTTPDADLEEQAFGRLSIGAKIRALLTSRAALNTKLAAATGQVATLGAQVADLTRRALDAEAALGEMTTRATAAESRVATLETESRDLHQAVTDELAGLGVAPDRLPRVEATGTDSTPSSQAELEERLAECQTHAERVALIAAWKKSKAASAKTAA